MIAAVSGIILAICAIAAPQPMGVGLERTGYLSTISRLIQPIRSSTFKT